MSKAVLRTSMALGAALLGMGALYPMSPALADNGGASPASPSSSTQAAFDLKQSAMTDLKSWIITRPGIENSGYVESVNDAENLATTLLWHGPANAMQESILTEAKRRGIVAKVEQRKYSIQDIQKAATLALGRSGKGAFKGVTIYSVAGLSADFDGIKVRVRPVTDENGAVTAQSKVLSATSLQAADQQVAKDATAELGIAVKVEPGVQITPTATARGTDTAAFNAGGYMAATDSSGVCSTGFAVQTSSRPYATTARHCTKTYKPRDASGSYGGTYKNSSDGAARVLTSTGSPLMFYGAYNSTLRATVKDYGDVSLYDVVCTSGGNSGTHCGGSLSQKVYDMVVMFSDGFGTVQTIEAKRMDGGVSVIDGDSGGPVYQNITGTTVKAVGMIQAEGPPLPSCGPVRDLGDNKCSTTVYFTGMRTIVRGLPGMSLVTG